MNQFPRICYINRSSNKKNQKKVSGIDLWHDYILSEIFIAIIV